MLKNKRGCSGKGAASFVYITTCKQLPVHLYWGLCYIFTTLPACNLKSLRNSSLKAKPDTCFQSVLSFGAPRGKYKSQKSGITHPRQLI